MDDLFEEYVNVFVFDPIDSSVPIVTSGSRSSADYGSSSGFSTSGVGYMANNTRGPRPVRRVGSNTPLRSGSTSFVGGDGHLSDIIDGNETVFHKDFGDSESLLIIWFQL